MSTQIIASLDSTPSLTAGVSLSHIRRIVLDSCDPLWTVDDSINKFILPATTHGPGTTTTTGNHATSFIQTLPSTYLGTPTYLISHDNTERLDVLLERISAYCGFHEPIRPGGLLPNQHPHALRYCSIGLQSDWTCDICTQDGNKQEPVYRCDACDFDAHPHCFAQHLQQQSASASSSSAAAASSAVSDSNSPSASPSPDCIFLWMEMFCISQHTATETDRQRRQQELVQIPDVARAAQQGVLVVHDSTCILTTGAEWTQQQQPQRSVLYDASVGAQHAQLPMPNCGVSLSFLRRLLQTPLVQRGWSTWQVVRDFVLPQTTVTRSRFTDGMQSMDVGPPTYFVSHRWVDNFHRMVRMLDSHISANAEPNSDPEEVFLWIDIFAVNQYNNSDKEAARKAQDLKNITLAVQSSKRGTLVVFDDSGLVLTRIWCLLEIHDTMRLRASESELRALIPSDMSFESLQDIWIELDVAKAHATRKEDRDRILRHFEQAAHEGHHQLNHAIKRAIVRSGIINLEAIRRTGNGNNVHLVQALLMAARLQIMAGCHKEAVTLLTEALQVNSRVSSSSNQPSDPSHPSLLLQSNLHTYLGISLLAVGEFEQAHSHQQRALSINCELFGNGDPKVLTDFNNMGALLHERGQFKEALAMLDRTLAMLIELNGEGHQHDGRLRAVLHNRGETLKALGRLPEARADLEHALKLLSAGTVEQQLASSNLDVANTIDSLASTLRESGDFKAALPLFERSLMVRRRVLGDAHPDVAKSYNNIGLLFQELDRLDEALEYAHKDVAISVQLYGEHHPDVATSFNSLGTTFEAKGQLDEALEYFMRAYTVRMSFFGETHVDTASTSSNIAAVLRSLGRQDEALQFAESSLDCWIRLFGELHPQVAQGYGNVGAILHSMERYSEAIDKTTRALDVAIALYGDSHDDISTFKSNLGLMLQDAGETEQALLYLQEALELAVSLHGASHSSVATRYINLCSLMKEQGKLDEALEFCKQALDILLNLHGSDHHPSISTALNNIGMILRDLNRVPEAIEYCELAIELSTKLNGEQQSQLPDVAIWCINLGLLLLENGYSEDALIYMEQSLEINLSCARSSKESADSKVEEEIQISEPILSPEIAVSHMHIALALRDLDRLPEAIEHARLSLQGRLASLDAHEEVAVSYNLLAELLTAADQLVEALDCATKAVSSMRAAHGAIHAQVAVSLTNLSAVYEAMGDRKRELECLHEVLNIDRNVFGEQHEEVALDLHNIAVATSMIGPGAAAASAALPFALNALEIYVGLQAESDPDDPNVSRERKLIASLQASIS